jgi:hypothetical protein
MYPACRYIVKALLYAVNLEMPECGGSETRIQREQYSMRTVLDRVQNRRCLLCYLSVDMCIDDVYSCEFLTQDSQRMKYTARFR